MRRDSALLPASTYIELVRALFLTLTPTLIMSGLFVGVGWMAIARSHDPLLIGLTGVGTLCSIARILVVVHGRNTTSRLDDVAEARAFERRFAITYFAFALVLGLFAAKLYMLNDADLRPLAAVLVVGYSAGAALGVYPRPWICVASIILAVVPLVWIAGQSDLVIERLLAIVLAVFTAGGLNAVVAHYRSTSERIGQHQKLATMTRYDPLTSLPNRLAIEEAFEDIAERSPIAGVWLHSIELGGIAEVNNQYGQTVGDLTVKAAASRLSAVVADAGLPARLAGISFCILQSDIQYAREAELLAKHVALALNEPYQIDGHDISLSVKIGSAQARSRSGLTALLHDADDALLKNKQKAA